VINREPLSRELQLDEKKPPEVPKWGNGSFEMANKYFAILKYQAMKLKKDSDLKNLKEVLSALGEKWSALQNQVHEMAHVLPTLIPRDCFHEPSTH
jgi:hypothetical protein